MHMEGATKINKGETPKDRDNVSKYSRQEKVYKQDQRSQKLTLRETKVSKK